jgi:glycosyltransferase involved in cell wall biosynthesis
VRIPKPTVQSGTLRFVALQANATNPLRVLIVHDSLSDNGGVRLTLDLAQRFARSGATAEVFALQPVRDGREVGVPPEVRLTRGVLVGRRLRSSGAAAALRLLRACHRADVVVSGSEVGLGLLLGHAAARTARRPFAVIVHSPLEGVLERWVAPGLRRATRRAHRRADVAICVSAALVPGVTANGLAPRRVHVVANAVDVERVRRLAAEGPPPPAGRLTVLGLGRLSAEKQFDLLVRAHAELRRGGVHHELEIVGDGPEREALLRLAAELGVADSVSLPGYVDNAFPRLARAAALVLPSRLEGLPLALLEALALDVPVIAARSAGASELLGPEHLVADDSVPDLVAALSRHLEHPERLRTAARSAAAAVEARTLDDVAGEYLLILDTIVGRTGPAARPEAAYE